MPEQCGSFSFPEEYSDGKTVERKARLQCSLFIKVWKHKWSLEAVDGRPIVRLVIRTWDYGYVRLEFAVLPNVIAMLEDAALIVHGTGGKAAENDGIAEAEL